jgi:thiol-disulfide isomerase/thioredoxin
MRSIARVYNRAVAALEPGAPFPPITLRDEKGAPLTPPEGETLYVVFKTTCPTCEFTWPYLERLRQAAGDGANGLRIVAVSQDPPDKAAAFNARLGSRVDTAFDLQPWPASDRLGVDTVPTFFRVGSDGRLAESVVGFSRDRMESLARRAAEAAGRPYEKLFRPNDQVPSTKAG